MTFSLESQYLLSNMFFIKHWHSSNTSTYRQTPNYTDKLLNPNILHQTPPFINPHHSSSNTNILTQIPIFTLEYQHSQAHTSSNPNIYYQSPVFSIKHQYSPSIISDWILTFSLKSKYLLSNTNFLKQTSTQIIKPQHLLPNNIFKHQHSRPSIKTHHQTVTFSSINLN